MSGGSISFDEIESREGFLATGEKPAEIDWLPEPTRRPRHVTLISVDDHLVEPPDMFEGRVPARFADAAPRVMREDDGATEYWLYDGQQHFKVGLNAVVGKPLHQRTFDPARFDEMRRGAYDIHARVHDMDLNGVYASLCFPSSLAGFAGQRYQLGVSDPELARAVVRAANDWQLDVWAGTYPGRIIPLQLPWLLDPEEGAAEIRANAARGFHAVTFPELPERLGLPSLHTGHWDPFLAACAETDTVVCLHVGSSSSAPATSSGAPSDTIGVLFFGWAMFAAVDWLYSKVALRFPDLKLCLSEGGIGWVAGLLDRLDHVGRYQAIFGTWEGIDLTPRELMQRNFWFCTIDDIAGLEQRHRIGVDHLLLESDYPHQDGTWPDTQEIVWSQIGGFPGDEIERLAWRNASELFRHPVPEARQRDPDADGGPDGQADR
jgi:predicted TIM-barrel fold metal-dependent hydrolase